MGNPRAENKREDSGGGSSRGDGSRRSYWILARRTEQLGGVSYFTDGADTMVVSRDYTEVIPVFSFLEEAELFLWLGGFGGRWRVVEVSSGTLAGMLRDSYSGVDEIALDPIPEVQTRSFMGLVTVDRQSFLDSLKVRDADSTP